MPSQAYTGLKYDFAALPREEKASFLIETALSMLGITGSDHDTVVAAVPIATQAVALASTDQAVFLQLAQYWSQCAPAAAIVAKAVKAQQGQK